MSAAMIIVLVALLSGRGTSQSVVPFHDLAACEAAKPSVVEVLNEQNRSHLVKVICVATKKDPP